MMAGSWMGSHFTNDDLVKESRLVDDYEIELEFSGTREGVDVWELLLVPLPEAPVVWGKIRYQVSKENLLPTWTRYYDESDELIRTMTFSEIRLMGSRLVPTVMTIEPADKPGRAPWCGTTNSTSTWSSMRTTSRSGICVAGDRRWTFDGSGGAWPGAISGVIGDALLSRPLRSPSATWPP